MAKIARPLFVNHNEPILLRSSFRFLRKEETMCSIDVSSLDISMLSQGK